MNNKEQTLQKILQIVIDCCSYDNGDGTQSITIEMLISPERIGDNVNMTRCIVAKQLSGMGYNNESIARILGRSESTVRDMLKRGEDFRDTSCAYRIAEREADIRIKAIKEDFRKKE